MQVILASQAASISELKKNPSKLIQDAHGQPVAILNHNTTAAYLIPAETYEMLMDLVDEKALEKLVKQRLSKPFRSIKVDLNEL